MSEGIICLTCGKEYELCSHGVLERFKLELNAVLALEPLAVRVCEDGAAEDLCASIAVTMAKMRTEIDRLTTMLHAAKVCKAFI